ncbi:hypothetical protein HDU97_005980 [Phlyctochytrium planicorne]|nr:hypothetical protein HDU97_005980 [Phlyctochytrium planicorne]
MFIEEMVMTLVSGTVSDIEYMKSFFIFYRKFLRGSELLDWLLDMFDSVDSDSHDATAIHPVQLRVCNVLLFWSSTYWEDFHTEKMRFTLRLFLEICSMRPAFQPICQKFVQVLRQTPRKPESEWAFSDCDEDCQSSSACSHIPTSAPNTNTNTNLSDSADVDKALPDDPSKPPPSFLDIENSVIVQHLNHVESVIFSAIKPRDLLHHIWSTSHRGQHSSSVAASINHFNRISSWVVTTILKEAKLKYRAKVLCKFMKLAQELRVMNNFNTLMAILAGISSAPIQRLRQTYKLVVNRSVFVYHQSLESLMSSERSFSAYRQALKRAESPCIPYLGVFLRDLLYIDEANKDYKADGSVNLPKFLLMADIILMMQSFQLTCSSHFSKPNPLVQALLHEEIFNDSEAYQRSLILEPRVSRK